MIGRAMHSNEIVSLTILLLMAMAFVASQADATIEASVQAAAMSQDRISRETNEAPFKATIQAHIDGIPLTISVDTTARFGLPGPETQ